MPSTAAAYAARLPAQEKGEDPVNVLVTGFGPFLTKVPRNSSWEIASNLPALIPASETSPTPIHIRVHHEAVRVAYRTVVDFIPQLRSPKVAVILHIGLAAGRKFFAVEQGALARGYGKIPDVNGEKFPDAFMEERFPPATFPNKLTTSFDTADVLERWRENLGYTSLDDAARMVSGYSDVRIHPDAGNFLCGFMYYNSLAVYHKAKGEERPVVFLHVPDLSMSKEKLEQGVQVTVALIKALVESRRNVGVMKQIDVDQLDGLEETKKEAETDNNFA